MSSSNSEILLFKTVEFYHSVEISQHIIHNVLLTDQLRS